MSLVLALRKRDVQDETCVVLQASSPDHPKDPSQDPLRDLFTVYGILSQNALVGFPWIRFQDTFAKPAQDPYASETLHSDIMHMQVKHCVEATRGIQCISRS